MHIKYDSFHQQEQTTHFLHPGLQVLHEEFAQIVQCLQLLSHSFFQPFEVLAGLLLALVNGRQLIQLLRL